MNQPIAPCSAAEHEQRRPAASRSPSGFARFTANQATPTKKTRPMTRPSRRWTHSQKKMVLKPASVMPAGPATSRYCGVCLVQRRTPCPVGVSQRRDRAGDRLPLGDRQAAFGQAGDAADHDHREYQRRRPRTADWRSRADAVRSGAGTGAGGAAELIGDAYARATSRAASR